VAGADYRWQSVRAWQHKAVIPAEEMAVTWQKLAARLHPCNGAMLLSV